MQTVLLVIGNIDTVTTLSPLLLNQGYNFIVRPDAESARRLIREGVPVDAAIVEYGLESGLNFCAELKHTALKGLPVIFLSEQVNVQDYLNALSLGASDFLFRPVIPRELFRILKVAINKQAEISRAAGSPCLPALDKARESEMQRFPWRQ